MPDLPGRGGPLGGALADLGPSSPCSGPRRGTGAQNVGLTPGCPTELRVLSLQLGSTTHQGVLPPLLPASLPGLRAKEGCDTISSGLGQ